MEKITAGTANIQASALFDLLAELCDTMEDASLCAMGGMTPFPVRSAVKHFPEDFGAGAGEEQVHE